MAKQKTIETTIGAAAEEGFSQLHDPRWMEDDAALQADELEEPISITEGVDFPGMC